MKNEKIQKINTVGKVGRIILTVVKVLTLIGLIASLVGAAISLCAVPFVKNTTLATVDGKANFTVRSEKFPLSEQIISGIAETDDFKFDLFGIKLNVDSSKNEDDSVTVIDAEVNEFNIKTVPVFLATGGVLLAAALVLASAFVMVIFAKKMAKALENCNSPFEENVIKSMKHFAFSMIPWGIIYGYFFNSLILTVLIVLIVMAIVYIFSYGAELQHESDDTV